MMKYSKVSTEVISVLFIILWVYAGLSKISEFGKFRFQVGRSPYIEPYAGIIAWGIPALEILIALSLVVKSSRMIGLYASFFLMALFTGYIYIMLHYSYFIPCSCGGILSKMSWTEHLWFNLAFTFLAAVSLILYKSKPYLKQTAQTL